MQGIRRKRIRYILQSLMKSNRAKFLCDEVQVQGIAASFSALVHTRGYRKKRIQIANTTTNRTIGSNDNDDEDNDGDYYENNDNDYNNNTNEHNGNDNSSKIS